MLTTHERAILQFEDQHPTRFARKEELIRNTFGIPAARYYQQLQLLLTDPDAEAENPMLIHRLRRLTREREERRRRRHEIRRSA